MFTLVFHLAVNKSITVKTQNIFSLIIEHSGFIKGSLNSIELFELVAFFHGIQRKK